MSEHDDSRGLAASASARAADAPLFSRAAWARILPFGAYLAFLVLGDMLERAGFERAGLRWLYPAQAATVALLLAINWRRYHELRAPLPGPAQLLAALATGALVFALWIQLDAPWMTLGSSPGYDPRGPGGIDPLLAGLRVAGAALVVPVMEELFWRSFLMRWVDSSDFEALAPARVGLKGFLVSVLLFGFEHHLWLAGIVAGAAYGLLYMRQRNLWGPVVAHALTNGLLGAWVLATGSWSFW